MNSETYETYKSEQVDFDMQSLICSKRFQILNDTHHLISSMM